MHARWQAALVLSCASPARTLLSGVPGQLLVAGAAAASAMYTAGAAAAAMLHLLYSEQETAEPAQQKAAKRISFALPRLLCQLAVPRVLNLLDRYGNDKSYASGRHDTVPCCLPARAAACPAGTPCCSGLGRRVPLRHAGLRVVKVRLAVRCRQHEGFGAQPVSRAARRRPANGSKTKNKQHAALPPAPASP